MAKLLIVDGLTFPVGQMSCHKKLGQDRFSRVGVCWTQTDRHPDKYTPRYS